jgi:hypothetical protein
MDLGNLDGNSGMQLSDMLRALTFEDNFFKRLQALEVIKEMIEEEMKKLVDYDLFIEHIAKYTEDPKFMREAKRISIIEENVETALEYYGRDYVSTPEFDFNEQFQQKRAIVDKQINTFVGKLLKELNQGEDIL